jgi:hypothetical protein
VLGPFGDGTFAAAVRALAVRAELRRRGVPAARLLDRVVAPSSWLDEPVEAWDGLTPVVPLDRVEPWAAVDWDGLSVALGASDPAAIRRVREEVRRRNAGWIAAADEVQALIWRIDGSEAGAPRWWRRRRP